MRAVLIVINLVMTILLIILLAHLWSGPKRWQQVHNAALDQQKSLEQLEQTVGEMEQRLARLEADDAGRREVQAHADRQLALIDKLSMQGPRLVPADPPTAGDESAAGGLETVDPVIAIDRSALTEGEWGDGKPTLGKNYLLPPRTGDFDPAKVGGTLRVFGSTPPGLNDILHNAANTADINARVNDSLCVRDLVNVELWRSALATSCVIEDDYKTFTFRIRPGVQWQIPRIAYRDDKYAWLRKPVEMTAADFAFYIEMVQDEQVQCPSLKPYYEKIAAVETPDPHTLVVKWKDAEYTNISFSMGLTPLPRHVYTSNEDGSPIPAGDIALTFNQHWFDQKFQLIGVGAYVLDDFAFDQYVKYRRNPSYWGEPSHFEAIHVDCAVKKDAAQLVSFLNGQVHSHYLSPIQFKTQILDHSEKRFAPYDEGDPKAGRRGELGWEKVISKSYQYIGWNMRSPLFEDRRVRLAMGHAFNRNRILEEVFNSLGQPQVTNVHPETVYMNKELEPIPFNLGKARELLAAAGWRDSDQDGLLDKEVNGERKKFSFQIKYYANSPEWDNTLAVFQADLRRIGIELSLLPLEWPKLIKVYEDRDFEAVSGGWRMGGDLDFMQLWHSKYADEPKSSNFCGFRNERADELAEAMRSAFDLEERIRIAKEFQAIIYEEQPYTFFRSRESVFCWQNAGGNRVEGVEKGLDRNHAFTKTNSATWYLPGE